jgi:DNA-binding response OmpR family regulator
MGPRDGARPFHRDVARRIPSPSYTASGRVLTGADLRGAQPRFMGVRVYLVEDSPIVFDRLQEMMQEHGAEVVGHSDNATAAIADIEALHPDVVVVDIALREGTGFHVLKAIGEPTDPQQPARIVLTNFNRDWYRNAATRLGADYFFDKSHQIREMMGVLGAMSSPASRQHGASRPATS